VAAVQDTPPALPPGDERAAALSALKAQASVNQDRIERTLGKSFLAAWSKYLDTYFVVVRGAMADGLEGMRAVLGMAEKDLLANYLQETKTVYSNAMERGFSFAKTNTKSLSGITGGKFVLHRSKGGNMVGAILKSRFSDVDEQAIDYLKEQTASGQRLALEQRAIDHFIGMNKSRTEEVLTIIADELSAGSTLEKIAEQIRTIHNDRYGDQSFTIARTEVLTAVSQGIKWNHDVLGQVFTEVEKQWLHIGDVGSNPDARDWHLGFENEGPQKAGYKWGGVLEYPRDPAADAKETINCRCTMVSVIPETSTSNADIILERE
jgi:hypothetical protein